ncbi:hypothetical protein DFH07DRAFT_806506 [Mycena maculata]|uniref:Uncharacterized protein n=1 Tax=Mycena maculata TaxID=230809 RepID=A0AAD7JQ30_9AGAR|nr:hypothetical protein DFH07DRAFT_806506 [Mycena maculata]
MAGGHPFLLMYFGPRPGLLPLAASLRFRCTPTAHPSSFDDGHDLLLSNGLPWQRLLVQAVVSTFPILRDQLLRPSPPCAINYCGKDTLHWMDSRDGGNASTGAGGTFSHHVGSLGCTSSSRSTFEADMKPCCRRRGEDSPHQDARHIPRPIGRVETASVQRFRPRAVRALTHGSAHPPSAHRGGPRARSCFNA